MPARTYGVAGVRFGHVADGLCLENREATEVRGSASNQWCAVAPPAAQLWSASAAR